MLQGVWSDHSTCEYNVDPEKLNAMVRAVARFITPLLLARDTDTEENKQFCEYMRKELTVYPNKTRIEHMQALEAKASMIKECSNFVKDIHGRAAFLMRESEESNIDIGYFTMQNPYCCLPLYSRRGAGSFHNVNTVIGNYGERLCQHVTMHVYLWLCEVDELLKEIVSVKKAEGEQSRTGQDTSENAQELLNIKVILSESIGSRLTSTERGSEIQGYGLSSRKLVTSFCKHRVLNFQCANCICMRRVNFFDGNHQEINAKQ